MAETLSFTCPKCKANLRAPAAVQGRQARCKRCNHVFVLTANRPAKGAAPPGQGKQAARTSPAKPAGTSAKTQPPEPPSAPPEAQDPHAGIYSFLSEEDTAKAAAAPPPPGQQASRGQLTYEYADKTPYAVTELDLTPRCPFCAGEMEADAIVCLNCGFNTQSRTHAKTERTYANTPMDQFWWSLPGVLCVLAVFALFGAIGYLWAGLPDPKDAKVKEEWWKEFINPAQVWGTILSLFLIAGAGFFAVKRLILNPTPPEKEKN
jgi:hypothetical protein